MNHSGRLSMSRKSLTSWVLVAGLFSAAANAASPALIVHGPDAVARDIAAADRAFSARSAAVGEAKAFREYMDATDGLEFGGGEPKRGAAAIYAAHGGDAAPKGVLTWEPAEVFAAASGDLGTSWGNWTLKPADPAKKTETGRYVTVWRKNAAGAWKGVVDIGDSD